MLPNKEYTKDVAYQLEQQLALEQMLPDGQLFIPPERNGEERHRFKFSLPESKRSRRASASLEVLQADAAAAKHPAFITPYHFWS